MVGLDNFSVMREKAKALVKEVVAPNAEAIDRSNRFPADIIRVFIKEGFTRSRVPKDYGGHDWTPTEFNIFLEEVSQASASVAMILSTTCNVPLLYKRWGNSFQKDKYLRWLANGAVANFVAASEHQAGSDLGGIKTSARREGKYYILNGDKYYLEPATGADFFHVIARTNTAERTQGLSCFTVERDWPGVNIGKVADPVGLRGSGLAELLLNDVRVPVENLIGLENQGLQVTRTSLDDGASIGTMPVGMAQAALSEALAYSQVRVAWERPLAAYQSIQFKLVDMYMKVEAARSFVYRAAAVADVGEHDFKLSLAARTFANLVAYEVSQDAIDIFGGHAVLDMWHPVTRIWRDIHACHGAGGTTNIRRLLIGRALLSSTREAVRK